MKPDFLKQFLELYWIRPETAIFNALLAKNIPNNYLDSPMSADINCGDGLFSFVANGGSLDNAFNLYQSAKVNSNVVKTEDIYSHFDDLYSPLITEGVGQRYDYGIDINDAMLSKASALPIYEKLLRYHGDKHLDPDGSYLLREFNTHQPLDLTGKLELVSIFSSIYMYQDITLLLKKINALLLKKGRFIVNVKTTEFRQFYERCEQTYPAKFSGYIERNMRQTINSLHSEQQWEKFFQDAGFSVEQKIPTMHLNLVPVWTIGLRFLTPLLVKMSSKISGQDFLEIKSEFTSTFYEVLEPFYQSKIDSACSWLYVLEKQSC